MKIVMKDTFLKKIFNTLNGFTIFTIIFTRKKKRLKNVINLLDDKNLNDKNSYVVHIRALKQALNKS